MVRNSLSKTLDPLRELVKGEVLLDDISRAAYSTAACLFEIKPLCIVLPRDDEDVLATVNFARSANVPVIARGGGSGLTGGALGRGIILDFTRYMSGVTGVDTVNNTVRVQPGLIYGNLNAHLKSSNRFFPPDPSSGNYASIGGMIANNASGAHALKYGCTIDNLVSLGLVLSNGETVELGPYDVTNDSYIRLRSSGTTKGELHRQVEELIKENIRRIKERFPRTVKNSSGYRLDRVMDGRTINLARLICASEGTLGLITSAVLKIAEIPPARAICVLRFASLKEATTAVQATLPSSPSAIEIIDRKCMELVARSRPNLYQMPADNVAAEVLVEYDGQTAAEVTERAESCRKNVVDELKLAQEGTLATGVEEQERLWVIRKSIMPILYQLPGPRRICTFVEDVAVPPEMMTKYITEFGQIMSKHGVEAAVLGHAGQGNFHTRPLLNLKDPADVALMRTLAEEVFDLALRLGGTLSGEHGDGLVRSEYVRKQYGKLYDAFRRVKTIFDPIGLFNPGKIVEAPEGSIVKNLRFGEGYKVHDTEKRLSFFGREFEEAVERCHGCGTCRTLLGTSSMCPVFKTLRDERVSPRGKANLLRGIISGRIRGIPKELKEVFELCLFCKSCELECPSGINVPKLILEARAMIAEKTGRSVTDMVLSRAGLVSKMGKKFAPVANLSLRMPAARTVTEKLIGMSRHRRMPQFSKEEIKSPATLKEAPRRVAYFVDLYASCNDPAIANAVIDVLEYNQVQVAVPPQRGCGITQIVYGDVRGARRDIKFNVRHLAELVRQGYEVICSEPSAASCLKQEYLYFSDADETRLVAEHSHDLMDFLLGLHKQGALRTDFLALPWRLGYHLPCHLRSLRVGKPSLELLKMVPQLTVTDIS